MMILNYVFPEDVDSAKTGWGVTLDGLKIFSKLFGCYPFIKEKYGHAEARGGMECQTMTSISLPVTEDPVIHELAHQWLIFPRFGDMIDLRISAEGMDTTITLFNDKADQTFHFVTPQDPVLIDLDPRKDRKKAFSTA